MCEQLHGFWPYSKKLDQISTHVETVVVGLLIWRDEGICECPCFFEDLDPGHVTV
jgi:hypothetical protein